MAGTPDELRQASFGTGLFGYRRREVDALLADVGTSFEQVWREREGLVARIDQLERDLARHVELEGLLRSTLVSAERAAQDQRDRARREADVIIDEAHAQSRTVTAQARAVQARLEGEARRIASLLRSALTAVEDGASASAEPVASETVSPTAAEAETAATSGIHRIVDDVA